MSRYTTIDFISPKHSKQTYNNTESNDIQYKNLKLLNTSRVRQSIDDKKNKNFRDMHRKKNASVDFSHQQRFKQSNQCQLSIVSEKLPCLNDQKFQKKNSEQKPNKILDQQLKNQITNRYKLAPNLNLRKTVYLYKKSSLQEQNQKNLPPTIVRKEKAFDVRIRQKEQQKRKEQFLRDYQLLTGFRTTLYQKTRKDQRNKTNLEQIKQLVGQYLPNKKRISLKVQDFTPWDA